MLPLCSGWATPADTVLWVATTLPPAKWVDEIGRDVALQAVVSTVTTSKLNRRCACRWVTSVALMSHGEEPFRQQCAFSLHWDSWIHCNGAFTAHHWEGRNKHESWNAVLTNEVKLYILCLIFGVRFGWESCWIPAMARERYLEFSTGLYLMSTRPFQEIRFLYPEVINISATCPCCDNCENYLKWGTSHAKISFITPKEKLCSTEGKGFVLQKSVPVGGN